MFFLQKKKSGGTADRLHGAHAATAHLPDGARLFGLEHTGRAQIKTSGAEEVAVGDGKRVYNGTVFGNSVRKPPLASLTV